jgi:hypothetical protein
MNLREKIRNKWFNVVCQIIGKNPEDCKKGNCCK